MGFFRQEYWSGQPFPSPGDLPNPGFDPWSPALQVDSLQSEPPGKPRDNGREAERPDKEMRSDQMRIRDQWGVFEQGHGMMELMSGEDHSTVQHLCAG